MNVANFEKASVDLMQTRAYSFWNMQPVQPSTTGIPVTGLQAPSAPVKVQCLSCGGKFVRAEDGSIPCGH